MADEGGQVREIQLTRGFVALVDDEDFEALVQFKWRAFAGPGVRTHYATRMVRSDSGARTDVRMHRVIMAAPTGLEVDHIDGNGLNNQRSNLRIVTRSQNMQNQTRKGRGCSSRFKGVSWDTERGAWRAFIRINGKKTALGVFRDEEKARDAYAAAAIRHFGEFAAPFVEAEE